MPDFYSFLKVASIGLVHLCFKNKIARRRVVRKIKTLSVGDQEQVEEMLKQIKDLKPLFYLKKGMKYLDDMDIDKYLKTYLNKRGIDVEEIEEAFKSFTSKKATKKIELIIDGFKEVDRITELKEQKLKKDIKDMIKLGEEVEKALEQYKQDLKKNVEKKLIERTDDINDMDIQKIKEEAIKEFLEKAKLTQPKSLKQGMTIGKRFVRK